MTIWAIGDLHLAIGVPEKSMEAFGEPWMGYLDKLQSNWLKSISEDDLVLIPGDISWAMHPHEAKADLEWIGKLPGTKVLLRGNHDYWWASLRQVEAILPPSLHLIQNNAFFWKDFAIGGARLWDTLEYNFASYIEHKDNPKASLLSETEDHTPDAEKIFTRELGRLELSLKALSSRPSAMRIAMTHYPPISATLEMSRASALLEKYQVQCCVFGHLHSVKPSAPLFGTKNGIQYRLTSADYLNFTPLRIV